MSTNVPDTLPDLELGDEPYDSAEDEDFELDDAAAQDDSDASVISDDEDTSLSKDTATKKRKLDSVSKDVELLELDSGDEATIRKAKKKKSKKARKDGGDGDEGSDVEIDEGEDGGAGGFVKTRAMRMRMYVQVTFCVISGFPGRGMLTLSMQTGRRTETAGED